MRKDIEDRANALFAEHMDLPPVYDALIKEGKLVTYPQLVEYFNDSPLAKKLPLDEKYRDSRKKYSIKKRLPLKERSSTKLKNKQKETFFPPKSEKQTCETNFDGEQNISNNEKIREEFYLTLLKILQHKAKEQGWAYEQAIFYDGLTKRIFNFDKTVEILESYITREKLKFPFSVQEISIEAHTNQNTVKRILRKLNLLPEKPLITIDEKLGNSIKNAIQTKALGLRDASYFLGVPTESITKYLRENNLPKFRKNNYENLSLASKVYEAKDVGFNIKEIAEYANMTMSYAAYMLERRASLEPKILDTLRKIHPDREISKPYL